MRLYSWSQPVVLQWTDQCQKRSIWQKKETCWWAGAEATSALDSGTGLSPLQLFPGEGENRSSPKAHLRTSGLSFSWEGWGPEATTVAMFLLQACSIRECKRGTTWGTLKNEQGYKSMLCKLPGVLWIKMWAQIQIRAPDMESDACCFNKQQD